MDFGKLDAVGKANAGFKLVLNHPGTGDPTDVYITVLGRDSTEYRRLAAEQQRRRLNKLAKTGRLRLDQDDDLDKDAVALLAACTKGWGTTAEALPEGARADVLTYHGEDLPCTRENAARVYTEQPWLREQVEAAVTDRANFLRG